MEEYSESFAKLFELMYFESLEKYDYFKYYKSNKIFSQCLWLRDYFFYSVLNVVILFKGLLKCPHYRLLFGVFVILDLVLLDQ
jgi:hypothetical protein